MVDVAGRKLIVEAVNPDAGKARILFLLIAQLAELMLAGNEGEHTVVISLLRRVCLMDGGQQLFYLGALELLPQAVLHTVAVQLVGCEGL